MKGNPRIFAATIIHQCLSEKTPLQYLIAKQKNKAKEAPWPYIQALCFGVMRHYPRIEWLTLQFLKKPIKKKDDIIFQLLLIGSFELLYMNTPDHAVIKETVAACEKLKKTWAKALCNAVLRAVQTAIQEQSLNFEKDLAAKTSHPKWLIGIFKKAWPNDWEAILSANNEAPPFTLRVNTQKTTLKEYQAQLHNEDIECTPLAAPESLMLTTAVDAKQLPSFAQGHVSIQDGAAQFAPHLLDLKPEHNVLDACAAPGGKTCHMLEFEPQIKTLIALDLYPHRAALIEENLNRLDLKASVQTLDATQALPFEDESFDRILLDAPCSATGIIRRQPDIKQLRTYEDIADLVATQQALLANLWPKLKPGGILLYATCSILPQENNQQIELFCSRQPDAQALEFTLPIGHSQPLGWQILPGEGHMDGFFYAKLQKLVSQFISKHQPTV